MVAKSTTNRILLSVMVGALSLYSGGNVHAVTSITDNNTVDSPLNGFNPATNLLPAANRTTTAGGPCFSCPNIGAPDAGNTTAGSLTDNMDGIIRLNNNANVGQLGRTPLLQGQTGIPAGANTASAFTVVINTPGLNDLGAGTPVTNPLPANDLDGNPLGPVGTAGMAMDFSTSFTFHPEGATAGSSSTQTLQQATFTGSQDEKSVQLIRENASFTQPTDNPSSGDESGIVAVVNWDQTIQEGGFLLSNNLGTFTYNGGGGLFPLAAAPTGPGQSAGLAPTCIGTPGSGVC